MLYVAIEMVQYIITPWRNHGELLQVRKQLYPGKETGSENRGGRETKNEDSGKKRKYAVAKVSVWMQRGNCPHLVESTAILTSAMLNDVPGNSAYCVRAAYSAAFCR
jgi:ribosomal biogenesis protein LAS1